MVDTIHKLITYLTSPIFVGMTALIFAFIGSRFKKLSRLVFVLAVIWLYVWSAPLTAWLIGAPLELEYPPEGVENTERADAICVLGGGMGIDTNVLIYADMGACADRVWQGARLYHAGKSPVVVMTGRRVRFATAPLLIDLGVPQSAFVCFEDCLNTEDEARVVSDAGYRRIILVTSAWHMRRARCLFERQGIAVTPSACDYMAFGPLYREDSNWYDPFIPNLDSLSKSTCFFKEHFAYWCYRVLDWVKGGP